MAGYSRRRMANNRCTLKETDKKAACPFGYMNSRGTCVSTLPCEFKDVKDLRFKKQRTSGLLVDPLKSRVIACERCKTEPSK